MDEAYEVTKLAWLCQRNQRKCLILTPYNNQVYLINSWLKKNNITCAEATTIHKAQGQEADIVIWSVVANITNRGASYFNKPNNPVAEPLANVALSRAKQQVFIIGADPTQPTVVGNFLANWENASQSVPSTPQAEPAVVQPQVQVAQEPKPSSDEKALLETVEEPEPISYHVQRCHYYDDWFDWNDLDKRIWSELRKDGVCTQKSNGRWTEPRLTAWFSESGVSYEYSDIRHESQGWPNWIEQLAQGVKCQYGDRYNKPNSVLVNVYRNGKEYVSMHKDDEPLFDNDQPIASVSLGVTRTFSIGAERTRVDHKINLEDKSLLLMLPGFQDKYWHGVPRQPDVEYARINLTFRYVKPQEKPEYNGPTTVVNLRNEAYDVYIGREGPGFDGYFGNPIVRGKECCVCGETHYDNQSIVACYRKGFYNKIKRDKQFAERISQLKGKRLGCFCKPDHCHGDVIVEYLESPEDVSSDLSVEVKPVAPQYVGAYAGIGARKTPQDILDYMGEQARILESKGLILRTGDASGADKAFRAATEHKLVYTPDQHIERWARHEVSFVCDTEYSQMRPYTQNLLARNMYQLFGSGTSKNAKQPSKFVLYWSLPSSEWGTGVHTNNYYNCSGGTRYAVRAACNAGIPTFNLYNQMKHWETYRDNDFDALTALSVVDERKVTDTDSEVSADLAPIDNTPEVIQPEVPAPTDTSGELDLEFKNWLESTGRIDKYLDGPGYRKDHMKRVYKLILEKTNK